MIGIIGTGLIGCSIGLRSRELGEEVLGYDNNDLALKAAANKGAIDRPVSRDQLYVQSQTVVIAAPPRATIEEIAFAKDAGKRARLILDVASVKEPVAIAAHGVANFVGTHPLAGSEQSGANAARPDLFAEKSWIYIRPDSPEQTSRVQEFITKMGARPVEMEAARHDALLALTSHLPQVFATIFSGRVRERADSKPEEICGPVARELLRLSRSNAELWSEILAYNSVAVGGELHAMAQALNEFAQALEGGDAIYARDAFLRGQPR